MKLFVASSWLNRRNARKLMRFLKEQGYQITFDWTHNDLLAGGTAQLDYDGVTNAEVLVVLGQGRLGTATEMGIAIAQRKSIFVVGKVNRRKSIYLFHPYVRFFANRTKLVEALRIHAEAVEAKT